MRGMGDLDKAGALGQESLDRVISAYIRTTGPDREVELLRQEVSDRLLKLPAEGLRPLRRVLVSRTMNDRRAMVVRLIDESLAELSFEV